MGNLYSPLGLKIMATRDILFAETTIQDGSVTPGQTEHEFEYVGETIPDWNEQKPVRDPVTGSRQFFDEAGNVWFEHELVFRET
jgi:hypothetical protein